MRTERLMAADECTCSVTVHELHRECCWEAGGSRGQGGGGVGEKSGDLQHANCKRTIEGAMAAG
jgi:hypothetical protein